ncbi:MAG: KilA-N domain-containing protein [Flavobacteriales bacterium]|nr:KilA-N domain-containing protein [Flavobacteriales bacterium]
MFNSVEFDGFRNEAGLNSFVLTPKKWIESTKAIGIISSSGRYGGTFAHKDIAFEFASWISVEFKLYMIKEFQRLKEAESNQQSLQWSVQRAISKINYRIHTDAIKENLVPSSLTKEQAKIIYASEADLLNVALFGMTAQEWKNQNPHLDGNIRDQATLEQLVVLSNMESINALLIQQNVSSEDRILQLNQVAISQMKSLLSAKGVKFLENDK